MWSGPGAALVLTAGTSSFLTSLMARWSLILARLCVSSTVIRTWRSSLRCSQLGFPRFISSWKTKTGLFEMQDTGWFCCRRGTRGDEGGRGGLHLSPALAPTFNQTLNSTDIELQVVSGSVGSLSKVPTLSTLVHRWDPFSPPPGPLFFSLLFLYQSLH